MLLMQKKKEKQLLVSQEQKQGARGHQVLFEQSPAAPVVL